MRGERKIVLYVLIVFNILPSWQARAIRIDPVDQFSKWPGRAVASASWGKSNILPSWQARAIRIDPVDQFSKWPGRAVASASWGKSNILPSWRNW